MLLSPNILAAIEFLVAITVSTTISYLVARVKQFRIYLKLRLGLLCHTKTFGYIFQCIAPSSDIFILSIILGCQHNQYQKVKLKNAVAKQYCYLLKPL